MAEASAKREWLVMNRKGPWEGYRQQSRPLSPSRLPLRAHFHQKRDVWVRGRLWVVSKSRQLLHTLCNENTYSKEQKKKMFYFNIFNGSSRDERLSFSAWGQCVPVKTSLACYMRSDSRGRRSDGGEQVKEGDMGVYVIAVLSFFSSGISPYAVFHPTFFILGVR